jgi:hypothetical protein
MKDTVPFASTEYFITLGLLFFARGMDFLSTWIATPNLVHEANPIAKRLGWKWGALLNLAICVLLAAWPLPSVVLVTTSLLVAARNFKSACWMRTLGESQYAYFMSSLLHQASVRLQIACLLGETLLVGLVGAAVTYYGRGELMVEAIGIGIVGYAGAVAFYTLLSVWRTRRHLG